MSDRPTLEQRLGIDWPIFQAPIGSVASAELAAAVSAAGGVGQIAATWRDPEQTRKMLHAIRRRTDRPFGVNFVLGFDFDRALAVALDEGVPIVSFFWGDAAGRLRDVRAAGALAVQAVGTLDEARRAADAGFDIIVAQGREAGGHVRGTLGTLTLLPQVVDLVHPLPVLAAGGIADPRGVRAARALGAAGVWVGTRFLAAHEADIHPLYQQMVVAAAGDGTVHSELFDIGWPQAPLRTLANSTTRRWAQAGRPSAPARPGEGEVVARRSDGTPIPRYHFAAPVRTMSGDIEAMALYAGEAVGLVRAAQPAAAIVADLALGFDQAEGEALVRDRARPTASAATPG